MRWVGGKKLSVAPLALPFRKGKKRRIEATQKRKRKKQEKRKPKLTFETCKAEAGEAEAHEAEAREAEAHEAEAGEAHEAEAHVTKATAYSRFSLYLPSWFPCFALRQTK